MTNPATNTKGWLILIAIVLALILIPFGLIGEQTEAFFGSILHKNHGLKLAVILTLVLISDVWLPIPSSLVSSYACQQFGPLGGLLIISSGMICSMAVGYATGKYLGIAGTKKTLGEASYQRASEFGGQRGAGVAIALSRAIPVLAEGVGLLAGALKWPWLNSMLWASGASLGVAATYSALFLLFGSEAGALQVVLGSILVPLLGMLLGSLLSRKLRKRELRM